MKTEDDADVCTLHRLEALCAVVNDPIDGNDRWQLSRYGMERMRAFTDIGEPVPVFEPRVHLPIADQSTYEKFTALLDKNWTWRRLPEKPANRLALPGVRTDSAEPDIFYTGLEVPDAYLTCLHSRAELHALGIQVVLPGLSQQQYLKVLQGKEQQIVLRRPMLRDGVGSLPPVLCLRDHDPEQEPLVAPDPALHDEVDSEVEFEFIELLEAFMSEEEEGIAIAEPENGMRSATTKFDLLQAMACKSRVLVL